MYDNVYDNALHCCLSLFVEFDNVRLRVQKQLEWLLMEEKVYQRTYIVSTCIFQYLHIYIFVADTFTYDSMTYLEDVFCFYEQSWGKPFE